MVAITTEMIEASYKLAKDVFAKRVEKKDAFKILASEFNMNISSASRYIENFPHMMNGEEFKSTYKNEAIEYYLRNIFLDFGNIGLKNALTALDKHIIYYETKTKGKVVGQRKIYKKHIKKLNITSNATFPDEIKNTALLYEGTMRTVKVNAYERSSSARGKCIEHYGSLCGVCEFDFKGFYGKIGDGFIHIHHLVELSAIKKKYKINPIKDLRPVCPNCHAMLHKNTPPYTIKQLKKMGLSQITHKMCYGGRYEKEQIKSV